MSNELAQVAIPKNGITFSEIGNRQTHQNNQIAAAAATPDNQLIAFPSTAWRGVFQDYYDATDGINEVCHEFNFASALTNIGAILGKRVGLDEGATPLRPNFFTVLVGETGAARKSTAMSQAQRIFEGCDPHVRHISQLASPEGLIELLVPPSPERLGITLEKLKTLNESLDDLLASPSTPLVNTGISVIREEIKNLETQIANDQAMFESISPTVEGIRLIVEIDEFSALLKKSRKSGSDGLIDTITSAYGMPEMLDLPTRHNPLSAPNPCLSVIGCAFSEWLEASMTVDDIHSGFANRFMYFLSPEVQPDPVPRPLPPVQKSVNSVRQKVHEVRSRLQSLADPLLFTFDNDAGNRIDEWYIDLTHRKRKEVHPLKAGAIQRIDIHAKKIALVFAVLENEPGDNLIHLDQVNAAIDIAEYLYSTASKLYGDYSPNRDAKIENKILDKIREKGPMNKSALSRLLSSTTSASERNHAIDALVQAELLEIQEQGQKKSPLFALKETT